MDFALSLTPDPFAGSQSQVSTSVWSRPLLSPLWAAAFLTRLPDSSLSLRPFSHVVSEPIQNKTPFQSLPTSFSAPISGACLLPSLQWWAPLPLLSAPSGSQHPPRCLTTCHHDVFALCPFHTYIFESWLVFTNRRVSTWTHTSFLLKIAPVLPKGSATTVRSSRSKLLLYLPPHSYPQVGI